MYPISRDIKTNSMHLLLNHFRPFANKITEKNKKKHFFQSLHRDEAIEYRQTISINSMTTLTEVLAIFRKGFASEDLKEVACCKRNKARYDPNNETFENFLKRSRKQLNRHSATKPRDTIEHSHLASCLSRFNRNLPWAIRKTAHWKKTKRRYCESTNSFFTTKNSTTFQSTFSWLRARIHQEGTADTNDRKKVV